MTRELLERGCSEVVLTVDPRNAPAVRAYTRLGYVFGSEVIEAQLTRRDTLGVLPLLRRWRARRRSDEAGVERITLGR